MVRATPAPVASLRRSDTLFHAVRVLLDNRRDVIAGMMAAGLTGCRKIRVTAADVPSILVMGADPVTTYSQNKLAERDTDGSADYVRGLAAGAVHVEGPFLAIARGAAGPITVFDGMHRMAAWVAHSKSGRQYPLEINLIITERPSPAFEVRPPA